MLRKYAILVGIISSLTLGNAIRAEEEDDGGKGKGKGASSGKVIQVDLAKLPPDLARALKKYVSGGEKSKTAAAAPSKGKAPMAKGGGKLPPGLASKPKDHPGRTHYIQHVLGGKGPPAKGKGAPAAKSGKGKGGPGKGKGRDEDED
jgi:hypothetical protein